MINRNQFSKLMATFSAGFFMNQIKALGRLPDRPQHGIMPALFMGHGALSAYALCIGAER